MEATPFLTSPNITTSEHPLLPKFHRQYYECLLENANIIHRIEINNGFHGADETIIYDGKLVADLFLEKANCEEITTKIIDDLYYFDDAFQDRIMELRPDSQYGRIIQLFRCIRDEKNSDDIDTKKIVDYFTNGDGYRLIIKYPQIYLTMLGAMNFLTDDNLKSLVRCEFDYNSLFLKFTKPAWLNGWFNRAAKSSTAIIILLNIIISILYLILIYVTSLLSRN